MPSNPYPGERVYEALGHKHGPEYQDRDLNAYLKSFLQSGRKSTYEAFSALREIAANQVRQDGDFDADFGGVKPKHQVSVPWWIIFALSTAWGEYREGGTKFEKAFRIGGEKQGEHTIPSKNTTLRKDQGLAIEVAYEVTLGNKVSKAVHQVSEMFSVSDDKVWKAWKSHKSIAKKVVEPLRK